MSVDLDDLVTRTDADGGTHHELHGDEDNAPSGTLAAPVTVSNIPAICQRVINGGRFTGTERSTVATILWLHSKSDLRTRADSTIAAAYLALGTFGDQHESPTLANARERKAFEESASKRANAWRHDTNIADANKDPE